MRWSLVAVLIVASCKGDKSPPPPASAPMPVPRAPSSTVEQDALWRLAPDAADFGIVASAQGVRSIENGFLAIKQLFHAAPDLKTAALELDVELRKVFGTSEVSLARYGMSPGKGMAVFHLTDGGEVLVLPVVNRAKFVAATKGTTASDGDVIDDLICKTIKNVYACAKSEPLLMRLGADGMQGDIKLAGARGDIEIVGNAPDFFGAPVTVAAVAQLARGTVVVRGGIEGLGPSIDRVKSVGKPMFDANKAVSFMVLNLAPLVAGLPLPAEPIAPGVPVDELARSLDAPVTMSIAPDLASGELTIPMRNATLARQLVDKCGAIEPLRMLGAAASDGVCHLTIPQASFDGWVDANAIHVGKKGVAPSTATLSPTPIATELASGDWAFAVYGRGALIGDKPLPPLPASLTDTSAKLGLRALLMVNELGVGIRADAGVLRFVASLRTAWSNPDDVVAKLVAISPDQVLEGKAGAMSRRIAKASPTSLFATDLRGDLVGLMIPAAAIGLVAGYMMPGLVDESHDEN